MIMLLSTAFALDCTGLTTETCDAVNAMEAAIEAARGDDLINEAGPARFHPMNIYNRLENVRMALGDDGCRADYSFDGWDGGRFFNGGFDGDWGNGTDSGTSGGLFASKQFDGTYAGDASGSIGDEFGRYHKKGQAVANRDDGFMAGYWIRVNGKRGIYVTLTGECDAGVAVNEALDPWFKGDLPVTPAEPTDVTFHLTVDNSLTWFIDGVAVAPVGGEGTWQSSSVVTMSLAPGEHTIAVRGVDAGGQAMFQFAATTDGGSSFVRVSDFANWNVWNGTTNGEPAGWMNPGFDDSGWDAPSSCGSNPAPSAPWTDPVGFGPATNFIWADDCSATNLALFRTTITL